MGDDNEIRQLIHREAEDFLAKARSATKDIREIYDIDAEFAKTRKNRSKMVPLVTVATLVILGLVAWGITNWIQARTNAAPVDVAAFDDLNLKDLLDSAKRNENDMANAQSALQQMNFDQKSLLDSADRDYQANLETIKAKSSGAADLSAQEAAAKVDWQAKRRQIQDSYSQRIAAKKTEIAAIQAKIDKYDQRLMQQAQQQKAVLDSANQKFDFEKQQLVADYERRLADLQSLRRSDIATLTKQRENLAASLTARYNPVFKDPRMEALLAKWKAPTAFGPFSPLPAYLLQAGAFSAADATRLDASLSDFNYISGQLRKIPYINSVPGALSRLESEGLLSAASYRSALAAAATLLQDRDASIAALTTRAVAAETERDRLGWAIGSYADAQRESGFVIDPRDPSAVVVELNPSIPVAEGSLAYIVRGEKSIATLKLSLRDGKPVGSVVTTVDGESMQPFDSILVASAPTQ